jgi:hypothetical protein
MQITPVSGSAQGSEPLSLNTDQRTGLEPILKHTSTDAITFNRPDELNQPDGMSIQARQPLWESTSTATIEGKPEPTTNDQSYRVVNLTPNSNCFNHQIVRITARKISQSKALYKVKLTDGSFIWTGANKIPPHYQNFLWKDFRNKKLCENQVEKL